MKNIRTNALFLPDSLSKAAALHQPADIIFFPMTTSVGINNRRNSVKAQSSKGTIWQILERLLSEGVAVTSTNYLVAIQTNHVSFSPWFHFIGSCQRITSLKENITWEYFMTNPPSVVIRNWFYFHILTTTAKSEIIPNLLLHTKSNTHECTQHREKVVQSSRIFSYK